MKNIKNKDLKGPLNNNFLSHLQKLKQQSVRSKAGDKILFQTNTLNKLGGFFNNNQFDNDKKVIYKAHKSELEDKFIFRFSDNPNLVNKSNSQPKLDKI